MTSTFNFRIKNMKKIIPLFVLLISFTSIASADKAKVLEPDGTIDPLIYQELKQGRWELVKLWATYCPVCKRDFEKLGKFIQDNPEIPITIIGVVVDGIEERDKALSQIDKRNLHYTHLLTNFDHAKEYFNKQSGANFIGVPSYILFNPDNEMVGFNQSAIDIDALEIFVYE